jgi:hypothetical protein
VLQKALEDSEAEQEEPPKQPAPLEKPKGHGRNGAEAYTGAETVKVTHPTLQRIAIDMQRDAFIDNQNCTINTLHQHRTGEIRKTG